MDSVSKVGKDKGNIDKKRKVKIKEVGIVRKDKMGNDSDRNRK